MKITVFGICAIGLAMLTGGCAMQDKKTAQRIKEMPIECATADGDLRMLDEEKKTTLQRIGSGVRLIVPVALVGGVVAGTTGTKYQVATGAYNQMIDDKIAEIKKACPGEVAD